MKITILAGGTRGDVQPYIALGVALKKAGQFVCIATFENYESFVREHGLEFYPIRGDVTQMVSSDVAARARNSDNPLKVLSSFRDLRAPILDLQRDTFEACRNADILIYHPGMTIAFYTGQQFGIPTVLATPFPMTPTKEYPALMFYNLPRLGKGFNWLSHKLFEQVIAGVSSSPIRRFWKSEFGKIPANFGVPYGRQMTARNPTIISCSEHVFDRPADWNENVHLCGYWFLEEGWNPPAELEDFIHSGKPPIYVGFGSIGDPMEAERTCILVSAALEKTGQRGILATGWSGKLSPEKMSGNLFIIESAPHSWLYPRMAAAVHHGGAGTTAAAFRAGIPQVVAPFGLDQFTWGRRVFELGVGPRYIPHKKLNERNLAESIQKALEPEMTKAARELGEKIQSEDGTAAAIKVIREAAGKV